MSGTQANPIGITNPPIDELLTQADSKYALVLYGAKRARQINAYYAQLQEGLLEYIGPLVDAQVHEKPLSIALREINDGLLTAEPVEEGADTIDGVVRSKNAAPATDAFDVSALDLPGTTDPA